MNYVKSNLESITTPIYIGVSGKTAAELASEFGPAESELFKNVHRGAALLLKNEKPNAVMMYQFHDFNTQFWQNGRETLRVDITAGSIPMLKHATWGKGI